MNLKAIDMSREKTEVKEEGERGQLERTKRGKKKRSHQQKRDRPRFLWPEQ